MKKESDTPNPLGFYGKSKLAGDATLSNLASSYSVVRTNNPLGLHKTKKSFPLWVKENFESKKDPVLVDQFTYTARVSGLSKMLIWVMTRQITGIIHLAGKTRISRYHLAELISEKISLDKKLSILTKIDEIC